LYVWYIAGAFVVAFLFGSTFGTVDQFTGEMAFNWTLALLTWVVALVGGIPVIVIFAVLEQSHARLEESEKAATQHHMAMLQRLDQLISLTRGDGTDGPPPATGSLGPEGDGNGDDGQFNGEHGNGKHGDGEPVSASPNGHDRPAADAPPSAEQLAANSRPFPRL
jgi:hypothetical protein